MTLAVWTLTTAGIASLLCSMLDNHAVFLLSLDGDPSLHPRERRPQAAVDAQPEGEVGVRSSVENELARPLEDGLVAVRRRD